MTTVSLPAAIRRRAVSGETLLGLALLIGIVAIALCGPLLAPHDPLTTSPDIGAGPSPGHPLGTDLDGRDVLSRVLCGGQSVVLLPMLVVIFALIAAAAIGVTAGYLRGPFDKLVTTLFDATLSVPRILLVLLVITGFGRGAIAAAIAVCIFQIPRFGRVLRAATLAVVPRDFVAAARARGESRRWIVFGEIVPNLAPTVAVEAAFGLTSAVLSIAALSFLGLGVQQPSPNWALMVSENRTLLFTHPYGPVLLPALLIALLAVGINLSADALARRFDARGGA